MKRTEDRFKMKDELCVDCAEGQSLVSNEVVNSAADIVRRAVMVSAPFDSELAKQRADEAHISAPQQESQLTHWPIHLHLIGHGTHYYDGADLLVAADCSAFASADFHNVMLRGRKLVIACPKLDSNKELYIQKLKGLIDNSMINTIAVAIMDVPCCGGLMQIVRSAVERSIRKVPIKRVVISVSGVIVSEEWL